MTSDHWYTVGQTCCLEHAARIVLLELECGSLGLEHALAERDSIRVLPAVLGRAQKGVDNSCMANHSVAVDNVVHGGQDDIGALREIDADGAEFFVDCGRDERASREASKHFARLARKSSSDTSCFCGRC